MRQRQLDSLPNFLLLHVQTTNIGVCDIRLLAFAQHGNRGVSFRGENIDQGVGVTVEGDRRGWLQLLAVECRKDANDIIGASRALHDASAESYVSVERSQTGEKAYF